jgi:uncharacterized membrane protein
VPWDAVPNPPGMSKARMEAFSDGVLAVAITLLVLNIDVPSKNKLGAHTLAHVLAGQWPSYAAYITSFMTIGIIWINHHAMIGRLRESDHVILILNLVLLMTVVVIPFGTDLLANYLRVGGTSAKVAAAVYAGTFFTMAVAFSTLNRHILLRKAHLLKTQPSLAWRRATLRRAASGVIPYVMAIALAAVTAYATLAICAALAVFYALPFASRGAAGAEEDER